MRKAEFGQSILSGLVIALLAILIDRLTIGFAKERPTGPTAAMAWMTGWTELYVDGRAPPTAVSAELVAGTTGGGAGTSVYLDDVAFMTLPATLSWAVGPAEPSFPAGAPVVLPLAVTPQSPVGANGIVGYTSALPSCSAILCAR